MTKDIDFPVVGVASAPVIVLVLDIRGRIVRINPYLEALSGYREAEVVGKDWFRTFLPKSEQKRIRQVFQTALAGTRVTGNVNRIVTRDGQERFIEWYDAELHDPDGRNIGLLAIGMDVTERQLLRMEAEAHRENAAHLVRVATINELASGLAHELSQPLTAITSYTQEALRHLPVGSLVTSTARHGLEQALSQSQRAAEIIQHLRDFVGNHAPTKKPEQINHLAHRALALMRPALLKSSTAVNLDLADDLPQINVDGLQIEQVILNLVQNAIEAMSDNARGKRKVTIKTALLPDRQLAVEVSDCGTGVKPANRGRVFEPLFTTKPKGMGMGLAICRTIIEAHGGSLSVAGRRPRGSRFRFTLPVGTMHHA